MVDDPFDDEPAGQPLAQVAPGGSGHPTAPRSAPVWSPDGTKIAYTEAIPDGALPDHSAVFVMDADGKNRHQVSTPFHGQPASCGVCKDGEAAWDVQATWKDDNTLAFIRWVAADDDAEHEAQEGTSVFTVSAAGGGESRMRHYPNEGQQAALGLF